jgi:DNA polymerase epsilon subunit 4
MFIQYLAGEGLNMAKLERKPRRNIQYKDLGTAPLATHSLTRSHPLVPFYRYYRELGQGSLTNTIAANAVSHQDNLQFLEDIIPKTVPYKQIKAHAAATRANLSGGAKAEGGGVAQEDSRPTPPRQPNGKKQKSRASASANGAVAAAGNRSIANFIGASGTRIVSEDDASMDPNEQLHDEMRRANREDDDVDMAG